MRLRQSPRDFRDGFEGNLDVALRHLERARLETDGDRAVDTSLRQIDAPVFVDSVDQRDVMRVAIRAAGMAEGEERQDRLGHDLEAGSLRSRSASPVTSEHDCG